jgi:outer membrane immunogenic protein
MVPRIGLLQIKNVNDNGDSLMRWALAAAIVLAAFGMAPALAADLPVQTYTKTPVWIPAAYDWSGFYLGLNGGGGSSRQCWTINASAGVPVTPNSEGCNTSTGGLVGGQIGYRWQTSGWVFGFELQGDWANLQGSNSSLTAIIPYANQTKIDAIGLMTGQVGYAWNTVLLYLKGGAAVTDNRFNSSFIGSGITFNKADDTRWGGVVGTGLEFSFVPDWSIAFEYDHLFMGSSNINFPLTTFGVGRADNVSQGVDIGLIKLNYRYGGPVIAKY